MLLRSTFAGLLAVAQVPESSPPADHAAITWRAPASCPARSALLQAIETRLGRPLRAGELAIDGAVTTHANPPPYRLRLRLRAGGPEESRTLTATTCAALTDATAVLAVTAIRASSVEPAAPSRAPVPTAPSRAARAPRRESPGAGPAGEAAGAPQAEAGASGAGDAPPSEVEGAPPAGDAPPGDAGDAPPSEVEGAAEVQVVEAPESASAEGPAATDVPVSAPWTAEQRQLEAVLAEPPKSRPRRAIGGFVRVQGGPEIGALPGVTGAVGLAVGLLWRWARLELHGVYLAPSTATTPLGELRASLAAASVLGCARPGRGRVEVPLCGGLELGGMRGAARDLPDARTTTVPWLAAVAGAGVAVRLGERFSLWGALQLVAGLVRPGFEVRDPGPPVPLFTPAPASGRLLFGVEVRLRDPR
ncbi:hypothetical protein [Nannocystis punicea]|uniref:Uncharacterized protein n=1 Tax=Nannocystis punicea TaxID=2995304 RepID=A0ABY7GXZ6_9BACT|nr:hypothetical protein [Nannocystis poenicansa]WAS91787.1 hypothetical protein O0S08_36860 [Nannocystis poenicansa]